MKLFFFSICIMLGCNANAQNFLWAKQISNAGPFIKLQRDGAGNLYSQGGFSGTVDFDPGPGTFNMTATTSSDRFFVKLNPDGDFLWARQLNDNGSQIYSDIAVDDSGNLYMTGGFSSIADFDPGLGVENLSSNGSSDIYILKLDSSGNFLWAKNIGGVTGDVGQKIVVDDNSNIYLAGNFSSNVDFDPGSNVQTVTSNGNSQDVFVLKLSSSGDFVWIYTEGSTGNEDVYSLEVDHLGNAYISSAIYAGIVNLTKIDNNGSNVWTKVLPSGINYTYITIQGNEMLLSGSFTNTCDFDFGSGTSNLTSFGGSDIYILKLDLSANFIWVKQIGGVDNDAIQSLKINNTGNIVGFGRFSGICDFDPSSAVYNLTATTDGNFYSDIYLVKLSSTGDFTFADQVGNVRAEFAGEMVLDDFGNTIISGTFDQTVDFDPGVGIYNMTSSPNRDAFYLKLSNTTGIPISPVGQANLSVYPNPSTGNITISSPQIINKLQITDALGKLVYSVTPNNNLHTTELNLATGMYFVKITCGDEVRTEKLVISK